MGEHKNTIVLNGQVYDSKTGSLAVSKSHRPVKSLEGFIRNDSAVKAATPNLTVNSNRQSRSHSQTAGELHNKRQHSKTIMRAVVSKPKYPKPGAQVSWLEPKSELTKPKISYNAKSRLNVSRLNHAKSISKSSAISRFYDNQQLAVTKKTARLSVKTNQTESEDQLNPIPRTSSTGNFLPTNLLDTALASATSHRQPLPKRPKFRQRASKKLHLGQRATNIGAIAMVVIIVAAFTAYQNWANISLHIADSKAGLSASLPGFKPAGFNFNHNLQASPGQVVINFHSNSDQRYFQVTQNASDWNSQTLLDNFVASTDQSYQKIAQPNGKTIFLYGDANATWVDGGIWYKIEGNSGLSSDQLLKIANSF